MTTPFYLKIGKLSDSNVQQLIPSFFNLPENPYKDGDYRLRRYSVFTFSADKVNKLPYRAFKQSSDLNKFQGDIEREYPDIETSCYESDAFQEMMAQFYSNAGLAPDTEVEVHQLRMRAKPNQTISIAPEGVHQDGFNRIGMFFVNYQNLSGGELYVHESQDGKPMLNHLFKDGEFLVLNDALFWHSANDVQANEETGYFDMFVMTGDKIKP
ncbi:2OG-Fe dioxygenase family protein [Psychrobacter sanguinis]|uniref:2OG-Fe dioxygenase family protein n=1 Tax=Psychrobacter sanguinis TaxID=861445 RepID=UPI00259856D5|nr:2OG-Fe dioxygenase family protein [Psychrobacter sanguinis]